MTITIEEAAAALGYPKPVAHRQRVCAECGSDDLTWGTEFRGSANDPDGWTGYEVEYCEDCDRVTGERRWVGGR